MSTITRNEKAVDERKKNFLTEGEIETFLKSARHGRHAVRNFAMMLLGYRHALRVSELVNIRMAEWTKPAKSLMALEPVTFYYNNAAEDRPASGLIAEDVAEVSPDLVIRDKEGNPVSVRYEDVNVMLLNEFLKEHRKVEEQQATISHLKSTVAQQQKGMEVFAATLKEQASQIQKVSDQLELSKPAPRTVSSNQ